MNKQPLSKILLILLANLKETVVDLKGFSKALAHGYGSAWLKDGSAYVSELKKLQRLKMLQQTVRQLRRSRYLSARRVGKRLLISLTDKGKAATLVHRLRAAKPHDKKIATLVIFDIPQSQNWARQQFRLLLKHGGFIKLQQSVWASSNDVYFEIAEFVKQAKLQDWVNVFYASNFMYWPKFK
ncbi:MAG: hypothetical protein ABIJ81_00595 [Patescibacteria group bacterium]